MGFCEPDCKVKEKDEPCCDECKYLCTEAEHRTTTRWLDIIMVISVLGFVAWGFIT